MAVYEFRLLDADGKVISTTVRTCATVEAAIKTGTTLPVSCRFVEIWSDGKVIGRLPKG